MGERGRASAHTRGLAAARHGWRRALVLALLAALTWHLGGAAPARAESVVADVPVGFAPLGVAVSPDGTRVYVTSYLSDNLIVFSTTPTLGLITGVQMGDGPRGVAVSPNSTRAYIANRLANTVSVLDTSTNTVVATLPGGDEPTGLALNPAGTRLCHQSRRQHRQHHRHRPCVGHRQHHRRHYPGRARTVRRDLQPGWRARLRCQW